MQGEAIHRHPLAHDDLHGDLGDDDDDTHSSHTVLAIPLLDCHRHTQQVYSLTVRHDDYLLLTKWKWTVIKAFVLTVLTLGTLGRGVGLSSRVEEVQQVEEVGGEAGEAGTLHVTLQKYTVISD